MGELTSFLTYLLIELPSQAILFLSGSPVIGIAAVVLVLLVLLMMGRRRRTRRSRRR